MVRETIACQCYKAINKGGEWVLRDDCVEEGRMGQRGNCRPQTKTEVSKCFL